MFRNFRITHRLAGLATILLAFSCLIGSVGIYKMTVIGNELEQVAARDLPLTLMLEKITQHQLEQAILMEKTLRYHNVDAHAATETEADLRHHFEELAKQTDSELATAHQMVNSYLADTISDEARTEFSGVEAALARIETDHRTYETQVNDIFKALDNGASPSDVADAVIATEGLQNDLDAAIENLVAEVAAYTAASMDTALADERMGKTLITALSGIVLLSGIALAWLLGRSITLPLRRLTNALADLAKGKLDTPVPASKFRDEVGDMADAMRVFQADMIKARALEAEQVARRERDEKRRAETDRLVKEFCETLVETFADIVKSAKDVLARAEMMQTQSGQAGSLAGAVATEAEESSASAQSLSAATEEMVAAIDEISSQITQFSGIAKNAVEHSATSQAEMRNLQEVADEVGQVVQLITKIADQTNLLALNATIEAARAGDAGKGFAVVAGEVKSLANQTAKATDEITRKIERIQSVSRNSTEAINNIGTVIGSIDNYVTAIVGAVEEQNATTREIARNVDFVSESAKRVSENVITIQSSVTNVGSSAVTVHDNADHTAHQADFLNGKIGEFITAMKRAQNDEPETGIRYAADKPVMLRAAE
ncbi:methyl-accepting chemotaxis protein [Thalassospira xiamenensis]|uniref:methyl-accepting chemotaxis protein n=1 Tax=Thalassospira xiamenensis TaxID=220697 RepID=UPI001FFFE598|nr:methyl-accepting chemotaxis protein [Thalassospira xiamenensis]MCK2166450.1 methyl-accepting chemotaxis protein [Thalassospira xiamenensis]